MELDTECTIATFDQEEQIPTTIFNESSPEKATSPTLPNWTNRAEVKNIRYGQIVDLVLSTINI